jgi:imidazolonepropionase-like amidohydrolase
MPIKRWGGFLVLSLALSASCGDPGPRAFVTVSAPVLAIAHVGVIDGTGTPRKDDQTVVIRSGQIRALDNAADVHTPAEATVVDGRGRTLIPGLVGMHEHLFYETSEALYPAQTAMARLYLAGGVTTIRTAGAVDFNGDLRVKQEIDAGRLPGPKVHLTGHYLNARPGPADPEGVRREVAAQADRGATSFKAYTSLRGSELRAAIQAAHARGLTITGHLCAVGFHEAAAMGIDNLEHGLQADSDFYSGKQPDECPDQSASLGELASVDMITDPRIAQTIADLVGHGVTLTSTLAVIETFTGDPSAFDPRTPAVLAPKLQRMYESQREGWIHWKSDWPRTWAAVLTREMRFERMFVAAGGRLMAGVDPTGWGGIVPGFGDQRELEPLVEAGFTPEAAIRIATANGAAFLREGDRVGRIAPGYQADLVLLRGDPSTRMSDVRNVETVFKDGVGYDSAALIAATEGAIGGYDVRRIFRWPYNLLMIGLLSLLVLRRVARVVGNRRRAHRVVTQTL